MNEINNINRGFESMIPKKPLNKEEKKIFSNNISFKIFNRRLKFILEVSGDD